MGSALSRAHHRPVRVLNTALVGLTAAGSLILGTSQAQASSSWQLVVLNESLPQGSGSFRATFASGNWSCSTVTNGRITTTRTTVHGGRPFSIQPYGDRRCSGSTIGLGISYRINTDDDRRERGIDCTAVVVRADRGKVEWLV